MLVLAVNSILLLAFATAGFYLVARLLCSTGFSRRGDLPPGPKPLPVIGNILQINDQPHRWFAHLAHTYGPLISVRLGAVTAVVASSSDMAREVLRKHDAAFSSRFPTDTVRALGHYSSSLVWSSPGPRWRALRRICATELFAAKRLDARRTLRREKVQEMLDSVQRMSAAEQPVDVGLVAFTSGLNLLLQTIFSADMADLSLSSSSQEFKALVKDLLEAAAAPNISDFFPVLASADLQGWRRRFGNSIGQIYSIIDEQIDSRLASRAAGRENVEGDILDGLLDLSGDGDHGVGFRMDRGAMRSLITELMIGGSESSSTTVEWAMTELLRNPNSMARAKEEIVAAIGQFRAMDEDDIVGLPFLRAVVKETLRLHPPAPLLVQHCAAEAKQIGDYVVPEGAQVIVNVWAIGHSEAAWEDAETFRPQRFLDKDVDFRGHDFELLPFGAGRRVCPGIPLADRMVHLMLGSLLHHFDWKVTGELAVGVSDNEEKFGGSLRKAVPLQALASMTTIL